MDANDQLHIRSAGKILHGAADPFTHRFAENLAAQGQAVAQHIGCQQHHRAFIQPQRLAGLFAALGRGALPQAGKILPQVARWRATNRLCSRSIWVSLRVRVLRSFHMPSVSWRMTSAFWANQIRWRWSPNS